MRDVGSEILCDRAYMPQGVLDCDISAVRVDPRMSANAEMAQGGG